MDLFDPGFLSQGGGNLGGGFDQHKADLNVVESIFGAQNNASKVAVPSGSGADLSSMSERDRRIYLRDLERKNRN